MTRFSRAWILPAALCVVSMPAGCDSKNGGEGGGGTGDVHTAAVSTPSTRPAGPETCKRDSAAKADVLKIAVIPKGTTHEFWKAIHAGSLKAQNETQGVQVLWKGPVKEDDRKAQIDVVDNFINQGVNGIALAPLDNKALFRPAREATQAGISVVILDSGLEAEACRDYASFVATDNYVGGQKGARRLGQIMGGKGKVLMMRYQEGSASTMQREQGFLDTLAKEFPNMQIVSSDQYGGATTESAYAKAENLLNRFHELDGIFTPNESTTFGMLRALVESGRAGKLKFVGFDSSQKLIDALGSGQIHGLVLQDPLNMGYTAVKTLVAYLRGEEVRTLVDTGSEVATPENMNETRIKELLSPPIGRYLNE
jgi:ribose transport system substrate-binding protein